MTAYDELALDPYRPWALPRGLTAASPLAAAISVYTETLAQDGASPNTVSAFDADLRLFAQCVGPEVPIGSIDSRHIERFREFLTSEREVTCSPTSLRRRLTSVQSFFRFLVDEKLVSANPVQSTSIDAGATARRGADILSDDQVGALVAAGRAAAAEGDWRPLLLLSLLLCTGISKAECLALRVEDIDADAGLLNVGSGERRRSLPLDPQSVEAYRGYRQSRAAEGKLFDCTGRNLEYVLTRLGEAAGMERHPSFRSLRATAAARLHLSGSSNEDMASRLGISRHTWPALRRRIRRASQ